MSNTSSPIDPLNLAATELEAPQSIEAANEVTETGQPVGADALLKIEESSEPPQREISNESNKPDRVESLILNNIDLEFYENQCGQSLSLEAAVRHYIEIGSEQNLDPSPNFSTKFYLEQSPDVRKNRMNPFYHYLRWGKLEGRRAHTLDDIREIPNNISDTIAPFFDRDFYYRNHPAIFHNNIDPVLHYGSFGWRMSFDPCGTFSTKYYLERNEDVRNAGANPFHHYIKWGRREGRLPSPDPNARSHQYTANARAIIPFFDAEHYKSQYKKIENTDIDPLLHYLHFGWRMGFDPSPDFSTKCYLALGPDILESGVNPLVHYVRNGRNSGRIARLVPPFDALEGTDLLQGKEAAKLIATIFDGDYYLDRYPDIGRNKLNPLVHFMSSGWREGRDPAPWFSTSFYVRHYADIQAMRINPLLHYLVWGRANGFQVTEPSSNGAPAKIVRGVPLVHGFDLRTTLSLPDQAPHKAGMERRVSEPRHLSFHWLIPDFNPGGGGHMTIFRMIKWLEIFGHKNSVWVIEPVHDRTDEEREDLVLQHYQTIRARIATLPPNATFDDADAVFATSWDSAYVAAVARTSVEKFYFVQDYEPSFFAAGARNLSAEMSYGFDLSCICASAWLEGLMRDKYGRWARSCELATDGTYRRPTTRPKNAIPKIAFYARTHTSRRAVELGLLALELLAQGEEAFHVDFFGADQPFDECPFSATNWGVASAETLARLYGEADIGVCFSATNYSLVPQEMMACGLPVIELDGASTRAAFPEGVVALAGPNPHDIAEKIRFFLTNETERQKLADRGAAWVATLSWEKSARAVESAVLERLGLTLDDVTPAADAPAAPTIVPTPAEPTVSVMIPTYNGGAVFETVLAAVLGQRCPWPFEVVIIDSGSTDGTWEHAQSQTGDLQLRQIPKSEFQHGRTRNLGIDMARGEFIAFLTQDALPTHEFWLYNMIAALERYPLAAGAFGRHRAWQHASPFTQRDIENHFKQFDRKSLCVSKYMDLKLWRSGDLAFRRFLHFYSDNNSCLRKSVWRRHPYPEIDYGEDQLWADIIIRAGYSKLYVPSAEVYHSHDYDEVQTFERARTEAAFFRKYFDYNLAAGDIQESIRATNFGDESWGWRQGLSAELITLRKRLNIHRILGHAGGSIRGVHFESVF